MDDEQHDVFLFLLLLLPLLLRRRSTSSTGRAVDRGHDDARHASRAPLRGRCRRRTMPPCASRQGSAFWAPESFLWILPVSPVSPAALPRFLPLPLLFAASFFLSDHGNNFVKSARAAKERRRRNDCPTRRLYTFLLARPRLLPLHPRDLFLFPSRQLPTGVSLPRRCSGARARCVLSLYPPRARFVHYPSSVRPLLFSFSFSLLPSLLFFSPSLTHAIYFVFVPLARPVLLARYVRAVRSPHRRVRTRRNASFVCPLARSLAHS